MTIRSLLAVLVVAAACGEVEGIAPADGTPPIYDDAGNVVTIDAGLDVADADLDRPDADPLAPDAAVPDASSPVQDAGPPADAWSGGGTCDVLAQNCGSTGAGCYYTGAGRAGECLPAGTVGAGGSCDEQDDCAPGLRCGVGSATPKCWVMCDFATYPFMSGDPRCAAGQICGQFGETEMQVGGCV